MWSYKLYIKTAKIGDFCEELLSEIEFEALLATFCYYDHDTKASEAVQKIATDQKVCRKCSSCMMNSQNIYNNQAITVKNGWLQGYIRRS